MEGYCTLKRFFYSYSCCLYNAVNSVWGFISCLLQDNSLDSCQAMAFLHYVRTGWIIPISLLHILLTVFLDLMLVHVAWKVICFHDMYCHKKGCKSTRIYYLVAKNFIIGFTIAVDLVTYERWQINTIVFLTACCPFSTVGSSAVLSLPILWYCRDFTHCACSTSLGSAIICAKSSKAFLWV